MEALPEPHFVAISQYGGTFAVRTMFLFGLHSTGDTNIAGRLLIGELICANYADIIYGRAEG